MKKVLAVLATTTAVVAPAMLAPATLAHTFAPAAANVKRPTFAGYEFQNYVAVPAQVSAAIVVPKLKCKKGPQRDIEPGVGMESVSAFAGLFVFCQKGKAHYYPSLEVGSSTKNFPSDKAHAGDRIEFMMVQSTSRTTDTVIDETHHFTARKSGAGSGTGYGPTVGDFSVDIGTTKLGIPNFGTLTFSDALANGASSAAGPFGSLGSPSAAPSGYNLVTGPGATGALQVTTGPLSTSGETFETVFKHP